MCNWNNYAAESTELQTILFFKNFFMKLSDCHFANVICCHLSLFLLFQYKESEVEFICIWLLIYTKIYKYLCENEVTVWKNVPA